ncbi:N-acetylmuramidase domain-containing protein [Pseudahrensia aquimaris]|uniref:N-acetylmuramidase domain-containing protein n=1 Tax=Pseudahrensia aquimaris TaxID=744461 RepID=A0ABW3FCM5_9HYPH
MFEAKTYDSIIEIAAAMDVPAAALLAVAEVESGGRVLAEVGARKEPLIRFEGHYFDRFLRGDARVQARKARLASPIAGRVTNPRSQAGRWKKLEKAIAINRVAALSACSWGLGQVMGSHWKWLGYGSVDALVAEARSGVDGQVRLMARFIEKAGLTGALRKQDWRTFARKYNGPAYAKNRYDKKMAAAFERHSKLLAKRPVLPEATDENASQLMFGARGSAVKALQKHLAKLGYVLRPDGIFGLKTDRTVRAFQRDHQLAETGVVGRAERVFLAANRNPIANTILQTGVAVKRGSGWKARSAAKRLFSGIKCGGAALKKRLLSLSRHFA